MDYQRFLENFLVWLGAMFCAMIIVVNIWFAIAACKILKSALANPQFTATCGEIQIKGGHCNGQGTSEQIPSPKGGD